MNVWSRRGMGFCHRGTCLPRLDKSTYTVRCQGRDIATWERARSGTGKAGERVLGLESGVLVLGPSWRGLGRAMSRDKARQILHFMSESPLHVVV